MPERQSKQACAFATDGETEMRLPRFVLGMLAALLAFALATYALTGAFWTTVLQTLVCAVLIQAGYFAVVVYLAFHGETKREGQPSSARDGVSSDDAEGEPAVHR